MKLRASLFALGCAAALALSVAIKPSRKAAEIYQPIDLEAQIPKLFSEWVIDPSVAPVVPDPTVRSMLNEIYTQTLARTYVSRNGERVMISIAYGADQGSDATQAHRPEFCYTAQGFTVSRIGSSLVNFGTHEIETTRILATLGSRFEPITYWMTLNDKTILPGIGRKLAQIDVGLRGVVPDGMLVRASTVGLSQTESFEVQQRFLGQLYKELPVEVRKRYFGH